MELYSLRVYAEAEIADGEGMTVEACKQVAVMSMWPEIADAKGMRVQCMQASGNRVYVV